MENNYLNKFLTAIFAGVAISISIGGPGAAFWIFFGAILGM
jgi:Na+/alanine symporter